MAVVFISPKQRQRMFFVWITAGIILFLAAMLSGIFFSSPKQQKTELVFNKAKISIDFNIFDSEEFQKLEPFIKMDLQFSYKAKSKAGKILTGVISAESLDEAQKKLVAMGFSDTELKEIKGGRANPFLPYYQPIIPTKK